MNLRIWIIASDEHAMKLSRCGVAFGRQRTFAKRAPNLYIGCIAPVFAKKVLDRFFETGEVLYGPS